MSSKYSIISNDPQPTADSKRGWIYPGWIMLAFSAAANFMSAPGQSYSVAAFKEPMRATIEVSETQYSIAYGVATILSGLLLPWIGRLVDRVGARYLLPMVAVLLGVACWVLSFAHGLPGLLIGFGLVRAMGQGALTLISAWIVGEWFDRRRGFATAMAGLGGSFSVMCFPILNGMMISEFGWEIAWRVHGLLVWLVLGLPVFLFLRDRPEDVGLVPDGYDPSIKKSDETNSNPERNTSNESAKESDSTEASRRPIVEVAGPGLRPMDQAILAKVAVQGNHKYRDDEEAADTQLDGDNDQDWSDSAREEPQRESTEDAKENSDEAKASPAATELPTWDVGDVLRHPTFWRLISVPAMSGMIGTGLVFHQVELMASRGIGEKVALGLISLQAIVATVAAIGSGWLTDRVPERYMLFAAMMLLAACSLVLWWMPLAAFAFLFAILMGLHGSILRSAGMVVWLTYYGRRNQGSIRGVSFSAMILAAAVGPIPFAVSIDWLGRYDEALLLFAALPIAAGLLVFGAKPPTTEEVFQRAGVSKRKRDAAVTSSDLKSARGENHQATSLDETAGVDQDEKELGATSDNGKQHHESADERTVGVG